MTRSRLLISVEGNIASGKSSVIESLKKKFSESTTQQLQLLQSQLSKTVENNDATGAGTKRAKRAFASTENFTNENKDPVNSSTAGGSPSTTPTKMLKSSTNISTTTMTAPLLSPSSSSKVDLFSHQDINLKVIPEPVDLWRNLNGHNLLDLMYKDPKRWAFAFQSYVQLTMLQNHMELGSEMSQLSGSLSSSNRKQQHINKYFGINVMERSLFSARYCFIENMKLTKLLEPVEYEILDKWFSFMTDQHDCQLDIVFYLRTSPTTCMERLRKRNRTEEKDQVDLDYLTRLHDLHENWLNSSTTSTSSSSSDSSSLPCSLSYYKPPSVIVIDGNKNLDEVYEIIERETRIACLKMTKNTEQMVKSIDQQEEKPQKKHQATAATVV